MELKPTMVADGIILVNMKNWISNYKSPIIVALIGALLGWVYWYYIGCASGSCAITSVWYRTMLYGAVMGWLVGDLVKSQFKKKQDEK